MKCALAIFSTSLTLPACLASSSVDSSLDSYESLRQLSSSKPCAWSDSKCGVNADWLTATWPTSKTTAMTDYATELQTCYALTDEASCVDDASGKCAWYKQSGVCRPWPRDWKRVQTGILTSFIKHEKCGASELLLNERECGSATFGSRGGQCDAAPGCVTSYRSIVKRTPTGRTCTDMCTRRTDGVNNFRSSICGDGFDRDAAFQDCNQAEGGDSVDLCIAKKHCPVLLEYQQKKERCAALTTTGQCGEEDGCMFVSPACLVNMSRLDVVTHAECNVKSLMDTDLGCNLNHTSQEGCDAHPDCEWEARANCDHAGRTQPLPGGECWAKHSKVVEAVVDTNCDDAMMLSFVQGMHAYEACAVESTQEACEAVEVTQPSCPTPAPDSGSDSPGSGSGRGGSSGVSLDAASQSSPFMILSLSIALLFAVLPASGP